VSSARPHVQAGKLVALGVTTAKRSAAMPEVPTLEQGGVKGYELSPWFGVLMPAGTPREVIDTMNKALNEALRQTEVKARLFALGAEPIGGTPEAFAATLAGEDAKWGKVIRERKIQAN
jgi:tripartite-type tricarboxylate transporter receptor subunit TctC